MPIRSRTARRASGTISLLIVCAALLTHIFAADDPGKSAHSAYAALPAPGIYQIDPVHSFVYFSAWHHIVGVLRGRFDKVTGTISASPDPAAYAVDVTMATYSISTQNATRMTIFAAPTSLLSLDFPP